MARPVAVDPKRLDIERWCRDAGRLDGQLSWEQLPRLAASPSVLPPAPPTDAVAWQAQGHFDHPVGRRPVIRVTMRLTGEVPMTCQRCLTPVRLAVSLERRFRFVADEAEAERLDGESDDEDVLSLDGRFDLLALVEDELILALPLVPRHARCPRDLSPWLTGEARGAAETSAPAVPTAAPAADGTPDPAAARPDNPFAVLARLKR
jgi:uncharacterized protein